MPQQLYFRLFLLSFRHHSERRFCLAFILNENSFFWVTISYQKPLVFPVSMFCFQISNLKLNLRPNIGLTYAISIVKNFDVVECLRKKIFFTFLRCIWIIDVSQQYCENFIKIEQVELVENLPPIYLPCRFLHNLHSFVQWEKVKIFDLTPAPPPHKTIRIKCFVHTQVAFFINLQRVVIDPSTTPDGPITAGYRFM